MNRVVSARSEFRVRTIYCQGLKMNFEYLNRRIAQNGDYISILGGADRIRTGDFFRDREVS